MEYGRMHPEPHQNVPLKPNHGGRDHHVMMIADYRRRFCVTLVLTLPVLVLSPMIQHWLGVDWYFPGAQYVLFILSSVIFFYGGLPFLKGWYAEKKSREYGMMTLIGFATTVSYIYSSATVFGFQGEDFFWELATLILIMLLGHWIEMKAVAGASGNLQSLVKLIPSEAHLLHGDMAHDVASDSLKTGDLILIKPGEKIPADGAVISGASHIDESMLTGESVPVPKKPGDTLFAGAVNGAGALRARVTHDSDASYLRQVVKLVAEAQGSKSHTELLADKAARRLTVIAVTAGIITVFAWIFSGSSVAFAIERMVTVVVICCPHALGLAIPLVVAKSTTAAARNGILVKDRAMFESARKVTTVVFDKTGTLTTGRFGVRRIVPLAGGWSEDDILRMAYALETNSEHPIASGITELAKNRAIPLSAASEFNAVPGKGIDGVVEGKKVSVVSAAETGEKGAPGETTVFVIIDGEKAGYITLSDTVRPESADAVAALREMNIKTVLLTGDDRLVAAGVCKETGADTYIAEVLPHMKLGEIEKLQKGGEFVAMTGDGVNDAPALAQADVGIAVGSGSDIAAENAGLILVNSNPKDVPALISFSRKTYSKMIQNLAWALGYNVITLPLAAGALYKWGILLNPAAGAVLMSLSTVITAINAATLKIKK